MWTPCLDVECLVVANARVHAAAKVLESDFVTVEPELGEGGSCGTEDHALDTLWRVQGGSRFGGGLPWGLRSR
jgi:hypothetical protein